MPYQLHRLCRFNEAAGMSKTSGPRDGRCVGVVEKVASGRARVLVAGQEVCETCGIHGTCSSGHQRSRSLWALDPLGVTPGDHVVVEASSEGLVAASAVLYGIPLLGLLCGALAGQIVWGETQSFIGAGIGVLAAIPLVRILANRIPENKRYAARIMRRDIDTELP